MSVQPVIIAQPGAQTVVNMQPVGHGHDNSHKEKKREWSSGICGCCEDCESFCLTFWFAWCYMCCCVSKRMGEHCCTPIILPDALIAYRVKMRTKYNIKGSVIRDCCCTFWCGPCAICQLAREIKFVEKQTGHHAFKH